MIRRAGIILKCNEHYILVKSSANMKWSFPKGHVEKNEDFKKCALREFEEETGMRIDMLDVSFVKCRVVGDTMYYFYISSDQNLLSQQSTPVNVIEIVDVKWFTEEDLKLLDQKAYNIGVKIFLSSEY